MAGGSGGGWTPRQARGSVWDSQPAPSQGHRSSLVVGRRVSKNQAAPGPAVGVERLLAVGGSKGLGHTAGRGGTPPGVSAHGTYPGKRRLHGAQLDPQTTLNLTD